MQALIVDDILCEMERDSNKPNNNLDSRWRDVDRFAFHNQSIRI